MCGIKDNMHKGTHAHIHMNVHAYIQACVDMCTCTHTRTYICKHPKAKLQCTELLVDHPPPHELISVQLFIHNTYVNTVTCMSTWSCKHQNILVNIPYHAYMHTMQTQCESTRHACGPNLNLALAIH